MENKYSDSVFYRVCGDIYEESYQAYFRESLINVQESDKAAFITDLQAVLLKHKLDRLGILGLEGLEYVCTPDNEEYIVVSHTPKVHTLVVVSGDSMEAMLSDLMRAALNIW